MSRKLSMGKREAILVRLTALEAGAEARKRGWPWGRCPHRSGELRDAWMLGWSHGATQGRRAA